MKKKKILWIPVRIATTAMLLVMIYRDTGSIWLIVALAFSAAATEMHSFTLSYFVRIIREYAESTRGKNGKS